MRTHTAFKVWTILFASLFAISLLFGAVPFVTAQSTPTIKSDQLDYQPGATVTLTGAGWADQEVVHIFVNDDVGQSWSLDSGMNGAPPDPVADSSGAFTYQFQLPTRFVANYTVKATGSSGAVATTTFTDGPLPSSVSLTNWTTTGNNPNQWVTATLSTNNSNYKEGETVPFRIEMSSNQVSSLGNPWYAPVCRDYAISTQSGTIYGYTQLQPFNTSRPADSGGTVSSTLGAFSGVGITILQVYDPGASAGSLDGNGFDCGGTQRLVIVKFNSVGSGDLYLLWGGRLSAPGDTSPVNITYGHSSSFYPGGSLQMRLSSPDKTGGINPGAIIQLAMITVTKVVDSGTATPDQWCFTATGPNGYNVTQCIAPGQDSTQFLGLDTGSYTITESNVANYAFVSGSGTNCTFSGSTATANVTAAAGGATNASCTFHNALQTGTLTVIKHVVNDNGGTATADQWSIHVKSGSTEVSGSPQAGAESPGTNYTLTAGSYTVSETGAPSGYTFTGFSGDCDSNGNVTVVAGANKTCTLTNDDQTAHLKLVKTVTNDSGGTATAANWTLSASGPTPLSGFGPTVESDVNAGSYDLSESGGPAGYTAGAWSCTGGTQSGSSITLALGQSATCTINNNDQTAHLTLVKTVTNDNGGTAVASDWTLSATGPTPISGPGGADNDVNAGTYTLSETTLPGYTAGAWSCSGGTFTAPDQIALALGQSATCTINNNDQTAHLKLVKTVTDDNGGTAQPSDWTLSASGPTPLSGPGPSVEGDVNAGSYDLSESGGPAGYTAGSWSCVGGTQTGSSITLALGQNATCTINNDDQTAHLTLVKTVTNDNGGTAQTTDFTLSAAGPTPISGQGGADSDVNAGTYTLSETTLPGYTAGSWFCTGGTFTAPNQVALALGQSATCTINNDDQTAHLKLVKTVTNDNGGTAFATDWTLSAAGPTPISGAGGKESDVNAGIYTLSETSLPGYTAGSWSCTGGTFTAPDQIALALGDSAICTINNNDNAPKLHLRKIVVNDNGGTATEANFTLTADGTGSNDLSGTTPVDSGAGLMADTWALSETTVYGYSASAWVCVGGTQNGSNITLGIGEEATCTITNDDQPGTIVVTKIVKPTTATTSFSFNTTGTGYTNFSLGGGQSNTQTLNAGSYTVQELVPLGWVLTGIGGSTNPSTPYNCVVTGSGGSTGVGDLNTQTATINLKNGDTVTCTFENTGQGVTRTQGFWATHTPLANIAWFGGSAFGHNFPGVASVSGIGDTLICGRPIDDLGKLMGGFWSDIPKKSDGSKRSSLDQARMQLLQQLLAAELNASAFGSVPSSGSFDAWEKALCGTSTNAIKTATQQAASFNSQGDSSTFTPGTSADSKYARSVANIPFWDIIKP